jgi:hypothetical protein
MAWIIPIENTNTDVDLTTTDSLYIGEDIYFAARATGIGSRHDLFAGRRRDNGQPDPHW